VWPQGSVEKSHSKYFGHQIIFENSSIYQMRYSSSLFPVDLAEKVEDSEDQMGDKYNPWIHISGIFNLFKSKVMLAVIILRSGKFAGTIFENKTPILHKTFRRYTIRAKTGGSQSAHDNKGKNAKSAGANLRRYGEQALKEDIKSLLRKWQAHLDSCDYIVLSVPKLMRTIILDDTQSSSSVVHKDDSRVRHVSFMVRQVTFEETKNILDKILTVQFVTKSSQVIENSDGLNANDAALNTAPTNPTNSSIMGNDEGRRKGDPPEKVLYTHPCPALIEACEANDVSAVVEVLKNISLRPLTHNPHFAYSSSVCDHRLGEPAVDSSGAEVSVVSASPPPFADESQSSPAAYNHAQKDTNEHPETELAPGWNEIDLLNMPDSWEHLQTPLHIAAKNNNSALVKLLLERHANPCSRDARDRTPVHLATDKETIDAFRWYRGEHEDQWKWEASGVGTGLTKELERFQREKEKEKKRRARLRKKEQKERDAEQVEEQRRAALEEEQRVKEEAGTCAMCGVVLYKKEVLDVFDRRVCSTGCVLSLRRKLAAEAAEKRLQSR